jgi:hypothetical protein
MAELRIDGPIDVDPALAMALYRAMPEIGQQAVAQMFASRLMSGPLSESAISAAAKVYAERMKIGETSARALREGVAAKVREWGEKQANPERVQQIIEEETRRVARGTAETLAMEAISRVPMGALIEAVTPVLQDVVKALAQQYFLKTQNGQKAIMELIEKALAKAHDDLTELACDEAFGLAMKPLERRMAESGLSKKTVGDNGEA